MDPVSWEQDAWARYRASQAEIEERDRLAKAGAS
jgi:hypothetical protein